MFLIKIKSLYQVVGRIPPHLEHGEPLCAVPVFALVLLQREERDQPIHKLRRHESIVHHPLRLKETILEDHKAPIKTTLKLWYHCLGISGVWCRLGKEGGGQNLFVRN